MAEGADPVTGANEVGNTDSAQEATEKKETSGSFNASTPLAGVDDLRKKAPQLYRAMLEGIAWRIIGGMRRHAQRLKEIYRESRRR